MISHLIHILCSTCATMLAVPWLEVFSSLAHVPFTSCTPGKFSYGTSNFKELDDLCISLHGCSRVSSEIGDMVHDMISLYEEGRILWLVGHKT